MEKRRVVLAQEAAQYDGSNAQEIVDEITPQISWQGWTLTVQSESGGSAMFLFDNTINTQTVTLETGDWVVIRPFGGMSALDTAPGQGGVMTFLPEESA